MMQVMIQRAETVGNIAFDDPGGARPGVVDLLQGCVASPSFAETVGMFAECTVKVGIQDHSHDFRKELVTPDG